MVQQTDWSGGAGVRRRWHSAQSRLGRQFQAKVPERAQSSSNFRFEISQLHHPETNFFRPSLPVSPLHLDLILALSVENLPLPYTVGSIIRSTSST